MSWKYTISTGTMERGDQVFQGYSGKGHSLIEGRNNPALVNAQGVGPIPMGEYTIGGPYNSTHTGPYTLTLDAKPGTETYGRSAFRIHGNNATNDASHGCIVLPPDARRAVWNSGDHDLTVVA